MTVLNSAASIARLFGRFRGALPAMQFVAAGSMVALAALAPAAHAVTVVSPAGNIVIPANGDGIYINVWSGVNGATSASAPGWDINPYGATSLIFYTGPSGSAFVTSANSPTAALSAGATISASSDYSPSAVPAATFGTLAGQWTLNSTNYFGFRFVGDDGLLHYGYGTMIVGATSLVRTVGKLYYESVGGASITISAVPEASTLAMMSVGGALVAGLALRRRRQTA